MSIPALKWAYAVKGLNPTQKFVLVTIANCHNKTTGQCNPRIAFLAEQTGLSTRAVQKCIREMERRGILRSEARNKKRGRGQGSNQYILSTKKACFRGEGGDTPKPKPEGPEVHPKSVVRFAPYRKGILKGGSANCSDVIDYSDVVDFHEHAERPEALKPAPLETVGYAEKVGSLDQ